ncbi:MAG: hypothetical protein Q4P20_04495 [Eubacteriales bacterium]|nr:hypothetical protein [Eubacteriales bacterium]
MTKEIKIQSIVKNLGYEPLENRTIVVSYAPANLSDTIARFFSNEFYILQLCAEQIILLPLSKLSLKPQKEAALEIPFSTIRSVSTKHIGLNNHITIQTNTDSITLSTQQAELNEWRTSGVAATESPLSLKNWHKKNLADTLDALTALNPQ